MLLHKKKSAAHFAAQSAAREFNFYIENKHVQWSDMTE